MKDLQRKLKQVQAYLKRDVKKVIGVEAVNFYKKSFRDEGFTDRSPTKWKEVKRRENPKTKGAAKTRKILNGKTKQLSDSIDHKVTSNGVSITSDVVYAEIHNEGGKAGRNKASEIPKRQFVGKSEQLNKNLETEIEGDLTKILNDV